MYYMAKLLDLLTVSVFVMFLFWSLSRQARSLETRLSTFCLNLLKIDIERAGIDINVYGGCPRGMHGIRHHHARKCLNDNFISRFDRNRLECSKKRFPATRKKRCTHAKVMAQFGTKLFDLLPAHPLLRFKLQPKSEPKLLPCHKRAKCVMDGECDTWHGVRRIANDCDIRYQVMGIRY